MYLPRCQREISAGLFHDIDGFMSLTLISVFMWTHERALPQWSRGPAFRLRICESYRIDNDRWSRTECVFDTVCSSIKRLTYRIIAPTPTGDPPHHNLTFFCSRHPHPHLWSHTHIFFIFFYFNLSLQTRHAVHHLTPHKLLSAILHPFALNTDILLHLHSNLYVS